MDGELKGWDAVGFILGAFLIGAVIVGVAVWFMVTVAQYTWAHPIF